MRPTNFRAVWFTAAQQLVGPRLEKDDFLKLVQNDDQPIFRVARVVEQRQSILQGCFPIGGSFKGNFNAGVSGVIVIIGRALNDRRASLLRAHGVRAKKDQSSGAVATILPFATVLLEVDVLDLKPRRRNFRLVRQFFSRVSACKSRLKASRLEKSRDPSRSRLFRLRVLRRGRRTGQEVLSSAFGTLEF